jgi:hypothetical protein
MRQTCTTWWVFVIRIWHWHYHLRFFQRRSAKMIMNTIESCNSTINWIVPLFIRDRTCNSCNTYHTTSCLLARNRRMTVRSQCIEQYGFVIASHGASSEAIVYLARSQAQTLLTNRWFESIFGSDNCRCLHYSKGLFIWLSSLCFSDSVQLDALAVAIDWRSLNTREPPIVVQMYRCNR